MSADRLLADYEMVADAPKAIPRLRKFIIDLAVRGKLVPQCNDDAVARHYLNEPQSDDLPLTWRLLNFEKFCDIQGGNQPPKSQFITEPKSGYVRLLQIRDLGERPVPTYVPLASTNRFCKKGEILIGRYGASVGKIFWAEDGAYNVALAKFIWPHEALIGPFVFLLLKSDIFQRHMAEATRSAQAGFNKGDLSSINFPLPPFAEQHRIVAKVDELMSLCDQLETAHAQRESMRDRFTAASLSRLDAPDSNTFREDACFALEALPALTARAGQIKQFRQTILGLAVVGKLTDRKNTSRPASLELAAVKIRKEQLNLRKPKQIAPILSDEHWSELPSGWAWARWDQISDWITYGFTRPMPHENDGVPIITGKNVNHGQIIFETADRTPVSSYQNLNEKDRPQRGDILITKDGSIGRTAVVDTEESFCINQSVAVLWFRSCHFDRHFLQLALDCPQTQQALLAKTEGIAIKHISIIDLGKMVLPVPPFDEQRRIVARVDELMGLCDRLEASLGTADETRRCLLEALLADALAPAEARELEAAE